MRRLIKRAAVSALATALIVTGVSATTASALNNQGWWNKSGTPLKVTGYGSAGQAYGYFSVQQGSNGTRTYNHAWHKFTDADNHKLYYNKHTQFNAGTCANSGAQVSIKGVSVSASSSCSREYYTHFKDRSSEQGKTVGAWTKFTTHSTGVRAGADRTRAIIYLCLDIPLRIDPCSGGAYSDFDTY